MSATAAGVDEPRASSRSDQGTLIHRRYSLRFAGTRGEVEAALRLRFEVFNLDLHEGFAESFFTSLDEDGLDEALGGPAKRQVVVDDKPLTRIFHTP